MKYAIGYFEQDEFERPFTRALQDFQEWIGEVYFPWPTITTCRSTLTGRQVQEKLVEALHFAHSLGIPLNLLCNANCYGGRALSKAFEKTLLDTIEEITHCIGSVYAVTTTSLSAAHIIKKYFPKIQTRASVNMRLGTPEAARPLFPYFDGFYLPREFNYDFAAIQEWKNVLGARPLYLLANSGCMPWCPGQTFHDNLVAHEEEISQTRNIEGFMPYVCWSYYPQNPHLLLNGTWIRPEDISHYEKEFSLIKLATRIHKRPYSVIKAYARRSFHGNVLNLLEPDHTALLKGAMLDNTRFPKDWFQLKKDNLLDFRKTYNAVFSAPPKQWRD